MKQLQLLFLFLFLSNLLVAQTTEVQAFLEDIVKEFPTVRDIAISPTQDEAFFTAQSHMGELSAIMHVVKKNNKWSEAKVASFSGQYKDLEPAFSPDGLQLYFVSDRVNVFSEKKPENMDVWYVKRESVDKPWSKPINIGAPINTEGNEFYPSVANNGNLYFTSAAALSKGKDDIFLSEYVDHTYQKPKSLGGGVNTESYEFNAFVAPDESFLIFSGYNRKDGLGSGDLYISYNKKGTWTTAQNMGDNINSNKMDYCPYVDIGKGVLYFTSKRTSVSGSLNKVLSKDELVDLMNQYENGLSRLYQVPWKSYTEK